MLEIRDVYKDYGGGGGLVRALNGVSLDLRMGELLMLMGPSGSGKTSLLSVAGCILRPTSGSVKIAGREVTGFAERRLPAIRLQHFGFVFQGFNLVAALTAQENVELVLQLKGYSMRRARSTAGTLLESLGMSSRSRHLPADLSGGEKQRIAIARALAGDPPILLADEPTAALDSQASSVLLETLSGLARSGRRAVMVVTHDPRALVYATRVLQMRDGRIEDRPLEDRPSTNKESVA